MEDTPTRSRGPALLVLALAAHAALLAAVELRGGQDALRPYVTDLEGPVALHGANTTLSSWLLITAGVLWLAVLATAPSARRTTRFALAQAAVLVGLAVDDRFLVHERLGGLTGIPDPLILGVVGLVQLGLVATHLDLAVPDRPSRLALGGAAAAFGAMLVVDAVAPSEATLRLAVEEITKAWGGALLAAWAWTRLRTIAGARR